MTTPSAQDIAADLRRRLPDLSTKKLQNIAYYPRRGYRETRRHTPDGYARVFFSKHLPNPD